MRPMQKKLLREYVFRNQKPNSWLRGEGPVSKEVMGRKGRRSNGIVEARSKMMGGKEGGRVQTSIRERQSHLKYKELTSPNTDEKEEKQRANKPGLVVVGRKRAECDNITMH